MVKNRKESKSKNTAEKKAGSKLVAQKKADRNLIAKKKAGSSLIVKKKAENKLIAKNKNRPIAKKKTGNQQDRKILLVKNDKKQKHAHVLSKSSVRNGKIRTLSAGKGPGSHGKDLKARKLAGKNVKGRNALKKSLASGKKKKMQRHVTHVAQVSGRNMKIHAGSYSGYNPPSIDQREAFEKQLLMEEPLDEQTLNVIESAYSLMGIPYQWGGTTPDGFDCSGFIRYVFHENGIRVSRSSREQVQEGKAIPLSELRPGDLIFFKFYSSRNRERNKGRVNHVGMYIGNGRFIHAASNTDSRAITVDELVSGKYFQRIVEARRILDFSAN